MNAKSIEKGYPLNSPAARQSNCILANLKYRISQARRGEDPNQMFQRSVASLDLRAYDLDLGLPSAASESNSARSAVGIGPDVTRQRSVGRRLLSAAKPRSLSIGHCSRLSLINLTMSALGFLDINLHLVPENAAQGRAYGIQLPCYTEGRWNFAEILTQRHLGSPARRPSRSRKGHRLRNRTFWRRQNNNIANTATLWHLRPVAGRLASLLQHDLARCQ